MLYLKNKISQGMSVEEHDAQIVETSGAEPQEESHYEAEMLEAFVGKPDEPDRGLWYANAFSKYEANGAQKMTWLWSWWAFGGGIWFLLYRKAYAAAGTLLLLSIASNFIPLGGVVIWILSGGYGMYFVYKVYKTKKLEIEAAEQDEHRRIEMMAELGGYNQWALVIAVALNVIVIIGLSYFAYELIAAASAGTAY